jgi:hypothetical protein
LSLILSLLNNGLLSGLFVPCCLVSWCLREAFEQPCQITSFKALQVSSLHSELNP